MMKMILAVATGGALGATGRFLVGKAMLRLMGPGIPWGTFTVNIIGSFAIGLAVTLLSTRYNLTHHWQGFLIVGVLGGFTTFSAFSMEVALMLERDEFAHAALYSGSSVILGFLAVFMGLYVGRYIAYYLPLL